MKKIPVNTPVPPKSTRFEKGKSGNPRGRPKGSRNIGGMLKEALSAQSEKVGMTKLEAAVTNIADAAANGDPRMLQMLLAELRRIEPENAVPPHDCMDVVRAHMEGARDRFRAKLERHQAELQRQSGAAEEDDKARG